MASSMYYYADEANNQLGPVSAEDLIKLVSSLSLSDQCLAWTEGMDNWNQIANISELKVLLDAGKKKGPGPPPPPPRPKAREDPAPVSSSKIEEKQQEFNGGKGDNRLETIQKYSAPSTNDPGWVELLTADRVPYYYHKSTESVSWEKPDALKTAAEKEQNDGEWVWVSDEREVWVPATVKSRSGSSVTVSLLNGSKKTVTQGTKEPLWSLTKSSLNHVLDDMVMVEFLNQAQMSHLLKTRYNKDLIYTWVGASHSVLVSVNPFKHLPIYTVNVMADFAHTSPNKLDPPHTFAIANSSFQNMRINSKNQAILISGESGAGKTEATKQCFNFLAEIAGSEQQLEQKILNSNPVLESFGNAKTLRNNNSSRFGRWTEINFSQRGQIIGASIENYLLEKSRVVKLAKGERSYHIFYQLCACMSDQLSLQAADKYRYLSGSGCTTADGIDDVDDFASLKSAFHSLDFSDSDILFVFECCAGILHLSNIHYLADGEGSKIDPKTTNSLQLTARFLKVDTEKLSQALCCHNIEIRGEFNQILHKPKEAQEAADALAKAIYSNLFNWLVSRINESVKGSKGSFIGVLDIFGFEIFEKNGFEQLCINFTNEKLQQHFNAHTFKEEEQTYISENVPYAPVAFIDNQPVLDLIEKKPHGVLNLLDEEVRLPKGDDLKWLSKCTAAHQAHPNWITESKQSVSTFIIQHYAGTVNYDATGFCEKNKDNVFRDLYDLMSKAGHPNFSTLFPEKDNNPRRIESMGGFFRKQLANLMAVCETTEPHYIRCIKPNQDKKPNEYNSRLCLEQLTYAGVFEAVQIRKTGYPFRLPHTRFAARYRPLLRNVSGKVSIDKNSAREVCKTILQSAHQDFSKVAIGNTMVLYKADEHRILELLRNLYLDKIIPVAQRQARRFNGKKFRKALAIIKRICKEALADGNDAEWLDLVIQDSQKEIAPFRPVYGYEPIFLVMAKDRRFKLQERVDLNKEMRRLLTLDAFEHFDQFASAVKRAENIKDMPGTSEDVEIEIKVREKLKNAAGSKIDPWATEVLFILDKPQMILCLAEAESYSYNSNEVEEIRRLLALPEDKFVRKQLTRANEIGDQDRVVNREIRLKDMFLEMHGQFFQFNASCVQLRNPQDWAYSKMFGFAMNKDKLAMGMLYYTDTPIHQSLTVLDDKELAKNAVKEFKNLMGYMGDRKYNYPDTLAQEFVSAGINGKAEYRIELYYQVMKQLNNNNNPVSLMKGWDMMALMISCFPPPESIENIVAMFIKTFAPRELLNRYRLSLHSSIYTKGLKSSPSVEEIANILNKFKTQEFDKKFLEGDVVTKKTGSRQSTLQTNTNSSTNIANRLDQQDQPKQIVPQQPVIEMKAPPPPPPPPKPKGPPTATAQYAYTADGEGLLSIQQGEVLTLKDTSSGDWGLVACRKFKRSGRLRPSSICSNKLILEV